MKDHEVRRLSRARLLEILIEQRKEIGQLKVELELAKAQLEERRILLEESGSIAEAALKINRVFEAVQAAADQYLESIKREDIREGQEDGKKGTDGQGRTEERDAHPGAAPEGA